MQSAPFAVCIKSAHGLLGKGASNCVDPYVKLKIGGVKRKTKVMGRTKNPRWDEWFEIEHWGRADFLVISIWSHNALSKNEFLGQLQFEFPNEQLHPSGVQQVELKLRPDAKGEFVQGSLKLEIYDRRVKQKFDDRNTSQVSQPERVKGEQCIKQMCKGSRFKLFVSRGGNKRTADVNVYWSDSGGPMGTIVWTNVAGSSLSGFEHIKKKMLLQRLCDIFVGIPAPHSKHVKEPALCMTLKDKDGGIIDLIAETEDQNELWLDGLKYILTTRGKKIVQQPIQGQPAPGPHSDGAAAAPAKKAKDRRFTVQGNKKTKCYTGTITPQVTFLLKGMNAIRLEEKDGKTVEHEVFVFFSKRGGKFGSMHWCERDDRDEDDKKAIYLHRVNQLCVGKHHPIFGSNAADELCVSIMSKSSELHMFLESQDCMKKMMVGLEHILSSNGRKVVLETDGEPEAEHKDGKKDRRFSRAFSVAVRSKATHPGVLCMAQGNLFTRYRQKKSRPDRSVKTTVFVFHSSLVTKDGDNGDKTGAGALFWYEKRDGKETKKKDRHCIPIHSITDVYCGKQHELFQTKCASDADDSCVFSIKGMEKTKDGEQPFILHVEADSEATVDNWMDGISHLLEEGGRTVESLDEAGEKQKKDAKKKKSRMSVAPPKKKAPKTETSDDDPFASLGAGVDFTDQAALNPDITIDELFPGAEPASNPFAEQQEAWDPFASLVDDSAAAAAPSADYDPFGTAEEKKEAPAAAEAAAPVSSGDELADYIKALGLNDTVLQQLKDEDVDMDALRSFEPSDLTDMGLKAGPRVKIIRNLDKWVGGKLVTE